MPKQACVQEFWSVCSQYIKIPVSLIRVKPVASWSTACILYFLKNKIYVRVIHANQTTERTLHFNIIQINLRIDAFTSREDFCRLEFLPKVGSQLISCSKEGMSCIRIIKVTRSIFEGIVMELSPIRSFCEFANRCIFCTGEKCNLFGDEFHTTVSVQKETILKEFWIKFYCQHPFSVSNYK